MKNDTLNPFPSGWFAIAFSHELKKEQVIPKTFMGKEIVLFRTKEGSATVLDAYCPHLGAHLGHGGTVEGNCIRCPFHHFEFNGEGRCTKTGHTGIPPKGIKIKNWPLIERDGFILLYHGNPEKQHKLPNLTEEGYKPYKYFSRKIKAHPQEILENSVDTHHFPAVHHVDSLAIRNYKSDDGILSMECLFLERLTLFGRKWGKPMPINFLFQGFGLGSSLNTAHFPQIGVEIAILSSRTPSDNQYTDNRIQCFVKYTRSNLFLKLVQSIFLRITFNNILNLFDEDIHILNHRRYLTRPILTPDDPIQQFRQWAKRFYE